MNWNKKATALLTLLLMLCILPFPAQAEAPVEQEHPVTLRIQAEKDGEKMKNARFVIYQICRLDYTGELIPLPEFTEFGQLLNIRGENADSWQAAARLLEQFLLESSEVLPTAESLTAETGTADFSGIPQGLYLVLGVHHVQDGYVYTTAPFFVQLPGKNPETFAWEYAVTVNTKPERTEPMIALQVVKVWRDKFHEASRPGEIHLTLYCDGREYDRINLPHEGKWMYQWGNLEANHSWHIREKAVPGYETRITREGNVFVVTNTRHAGTSSSRLPQTGLLWWPVPLLATGGLGLVLLGLLRRRKCRE